MAEAEAEEANNFETFASFAYLLSPLILRALADLGFSRPTLVQQKAIPLALENRDVLARARTGSGKTAAYCIPLVQKLLNAKAVGTVPWGVILSQLSLQAPFPPVRLCRILPSRMIHDIAQER